ncbi:BnaC03g42530D [Brassica napus]|uniref:BnaC03g42530D protein n=3 Tax=Brassica TaxID=3705 RepID=A0A078GCS3_BRANA|nr:BnaC03g42530D [Brassica napus]VDC94157.1 unnamed protein product [Brassica oleracea]
MDQFGGFHLQEQKNKFSYRHTSLPSLSLRLRTTMNGSWKMIGLPRSKSKRHQTLLTLLAWKSTIYWTWNERNARLHFNVYRSVDTIFAVIDRQLRNKIMSFRESNPVLSSAMLQAWFSVG